MAEALAFGSLLKQGVPVRLSGQDSRRGTFNQRHAALIDIETEKEVRAARACSRRDPAWFEIYNSTLSEASVLGFEYGFSRDFPEALVLWEAQFGDFANGAQIIIDQFVSAGEDKWNLLSGVVLLLPHGYEGQGPEHSSARIERFLQLAARDNIQICQPSTAAQYFHLLRRQALRVWRKPLVVFTPKSMLRNPAASSTLADLAAPRFRPVIPDRGDGSASSVLLCTGKIGHELEAERKRRKDTSTAIVFLEQLYPLPEAELSAEMDRHAERARVRMGAGGACEHGRAGIPDAAARTAGARTGRAVREALGQRKSRYRFAQSARVGAEDAAYGSVRKHIEELGRLKVLLRFRTAPRWA